MLTIHVWPRRLKEFLLTHPLYKSPYAISIVRRSPAPDGGLRQLWEGVAPRLLKHLLARGKVPGEMLVRSQRLFRMLRPLCLDIPLKLSLHDKLPGVNANA